VRRYDWTPITYPKTPNLRRFLEKYDEKYFDRIQSKILYLCQLGSGPMKNRVSHIRR